MDKEEFADLHGLRVRLDQEAGPFRRCAVGQECETASQTAIVSPGVGPHIAQLKCADCGRHLSWIGRTHLEALRASQRRGAA